jgi:hypothetical protein
VDNLFRFKLTEPLYIEAHQRWYQQTAADFFDFYLLDSDPLPTYASADHRLGNLQTTTYGITFGYQFAKNQSISWRNEWYHQADPIDGSLAAQMDVIISQVNYSLGF